MKKVKTLPELINENEKKIDYLQLRCFEPDYWRNFKSGRTISYTAEHRNALRVGLFLNSMSLPPDNLFPISRLAHNEKFKFLVSDAQKCAKYLGISIDKLYAIKFEDHVSCTKMVFIDNSKIALVPFEIAKLYENHTNTEPYDFSPEKKRCLHIDDYVKEMFNRNCYDMQNHLSKADFKKYFHTFNYMDDMDYPVLSLRYMHAFHKMSKTVRFKYFQKFSKESFSFFSSITKDILNSITKYYQSIAQDDLLSNFLQDEKGFVKLFKIMSPVEPKLNYGVWFLDKDTAIKNKFIYGKGFLYTAKIQVSNIALCTTARYSLGYDVEASLYQPQVVFCDVDNLVGVSLSASYSKKYSTSSPKPLTK